MVVHYPLLGGLSSLGFQDSTSLGFPLISLVTPFLSLKLAPLHIPDPLEAPMTSFLPTHIYLSCFKCHLCASDPKFTSKAQASLPNSRLIYPTAYSIPSPPVFSSNVIYNASLIMSAVYSLAPIPLLERKLLEDRVLVLFTCILSTYSSAWLMFTPGKYL